ncbi:unnamed protein product [Agarophyton chilense]
MPESPATRAAHAQSPLAAAGGTLGVAYSLTTKREGLKDTVFGTRPNLASYVAINMKDALHTKSLEELRLEDYNLANLVHPFSNTPNSVRPPEHHPSNPATSTCPRTVSFRDPLVSSSLPHSSTTATLASASSRPVNRDVPFCTHPPFISPSPFPSQSNCAPTTFQPPPPPVTQTCAHNNRYDVFSDWFANHSSQPSPSPFQPHHPSFSCPSPAPAPANASSPADAFSLAADPFAAHAVNTSPPSAFSRTVMQRQTFFTQPGENHGPVFNEIRVSHTYHCPYACHR